MQSGAFLIRAARSEEREVIASLWRELMEMHRRLDPRFTLARDAERQYARHIRAMIQSRDALVLVACDRLTDEVLGFLVGELQSRSPKVMPGLYGFISDIYVREAWRQRGVGKALCVEMLHWFRVRKAVAVELYVAEANPAARAFWQSLGLTPFLQLLHLDL